MKLLYAEDELALSMAVAEILKMEGFQVDAVYDGRSALEHLRSNSYDGVVMDIMMPEMSGMEVLKAIREDGNFTPVLLLTAKTQVEDRINGLELGADDYLAKPFDMGELVARIKSMLRRTQKYGKPTLSVGNLTLDMDKNMISTQYGALGVSSKESDLLSLLIRADGEGADIAEIMERVWPDEDDSATAVLYLTYLKNKLRQLRAYLTIKKEGNRFFLVTEDSQQK
ncbi:MAG: response regulator transcription factor [Lachnospiraceae bacterium]|nr:response regulator transcription factor [Lachnospiraceae bacterium]